MAQTLDVDRVATLIVTTIKSATAALKERIEKLENGTGSTARHFDIERRLRALEDHPALIQHKGDGIPVTVYRELWNRATTYRKGESVTWDGSWWIAREDNVGSEPGDKSKPKTWALAAMRGRAGRCECSR